MKKQISIILASSIMCLSTANASFKSLILPATVGVTGYAIGKSLSNSEQRDATNREKTKSFIMVGNSIYDMNNITSIRVIEKRCEYVRITRHTKGSTEEKIGETCDEAKSALKEILKEIVSKQ